MMEEKNGMQVLVTGARGFVGRNLCVALRRLPDLRLFEYDVDSRPQDLDEALKTADIVFHLAGVNRPQNVEDYQTGNTDFTAEICDKLQQWGCAPRIVMSSSIQAELDNPYGVSKRLAEESLKRFAADTGAQCVVYRLKNLFGKWCRPNYNSVTATFCYNAAHGLPLQISDRKNVVELTYIDDVVQAFVNEIEQAFQPGFRMALPLASRAITLGELADIIKGFAAHRDTLRLPDYNDPFMRALYATYLSYLDRDDFAYNLDIKADNRGSLAELIKAPCFGQIFVSRTKPGITRGNHYHHTKTEKFMVVQGEGIIRLRQINGDDVIEYVARGEDYRVVDIPPGYTHSIENTGNNEMVTLFWSSEVFDPEHTDTYFEPVLSSE
ncbi:MAG: NAD-dependent epimerase/dehydratase family protein [bacterium]|jgi:UDP-2-acetamido-2,6-beta-L-arabino-hexul-4-ose reductase